MSEILHSKCKQYGIPYCKHWTRHVHVLKCLPDDGYLSPKHVANFTLLNILLCFDWTTFKLVLKHNGMAPIKKIGLLRWLAELFASDVSKERSAFISRGRRVLE
jgi:hypothetical protein